MALSPLSVWICVRCQRAAGPSRAAVALVLSLWCNSRCLSGTHKLARVLRVAVSAQVLQAAISSFQPRFQSDRIFINGFLARHQ